MKVLDLSGTPLSLQTLAMWARATKTWENKLSLPLGLCSPSPQEGSKFYASQLHRQSSRLEALGETCSEVPSSEWRSLPPLNGAQQVGPPRLG